MRFAGRIQPTAASTLIALAVAGLVACGGSDNTPAPELSVVGGARGYVDGPAAQARFSWPEPYRNQTSESGMSFNQAGDLLIADSGNQAVRKLSTDGQVTTLALAPRDFSSIDGPGPFSTRYSVTDMASDAAGNIYLSEPAHHLIRKVGAQMR
ncbi:MAG: hypothetical protein JSS31_18850 [Proteobacteria bacterium]|nr:hypothetical protein [Pseudomonadota bacterium]MBS0495951.1 hypothetical protein [Pseudomonadota bacterium]